MSFGSEGMGVHGGSVGPQRYWLKHPAMVLVWHCVVEDMATDMENERTPPLRALTQRGTSSTCE